MYSQFTSFLPPLSVCFSLQVMCIADKKRKPVLSLYAALVCDTQLYFVQWVDKMAERQLQFHNLSLTQLSKKETQKVFVIEKVIISDKASLLLMD